MEYAIGHSALPKLRVDCLILPLGSDATVPESLPDETRKAVQAFMKAGDFSGEINLKTYDLLINHVYPVNTTVLGSFLSYPRYAGPREAVFTAICRQNFGCSHFIVGRDHTGVGDFYPPDASQRLFEEMGDIGIKPVFFEEVYYCQQCKIHVQRCDHGSEYIQRISGSRAREIFCQGEAPPDWYMREQVSRLILDELNRGVEVFST